MNVIFIVFLLLIVCICYFAFAIWTGKTVKKKVNAQTVPVMDEIPTMPLFVPPSKQHTKRIKQSARIMSQQKFRRFVRQQRYYDDKKKKC